MKKRIAHLADLHFDIDHREDALNCFEFAVSHAIHYECEALVIAGDIWDRSIQVDDRSPFTPVFQCVRQASQFMPVIIIAGNHDRPGSLAPFVFAEAEHPVRVITQGPEAFILSGILFSCLPWPTKAYLLSRMNGSQDETDLIAGDAIRQIMTGFAAYHADQNLLPHLLVAHLNVTGSETESGQVMLGGDVMVSASDLEMSGADYVALGHIHKRQMLGAKCWYPGSLYHCNFGELEPKYMHIVDVWPGGYEIDEIRLPSRPKVVIDDPDFSDFDILKDADVKLRVRLTEEELRTFDESERSAFLRELGAHSVTIERIVIPRERVRCEIITEATTLRDKVTAWGETVGETIQESALQKADELEVST